MLVARELEPVAGELQSALGLREPFRDPGVAAFGLTNAVFALGDCFLEIVSPAQPNTAAGRYIERHGGDGGYMVMFDLEDLDSARGRAERAGVRVVWQIDLPDISGTHLHPADTRGAIVSIDASRPYGSWRWGGPDWTARVGDGAPGRLRGVTVAVADPDAVVTRWAEVLGVPVAANGAPVLELEDAKVAFATAERESEEGLKEIVVELPPEVRRAREEVQVGGARLRLLDAA
ncbi:MAG TPA: VOC family protein [Solirubrobacteraceae bacterium]|nr:VOC family protein [Solirubrobacteraceae bacterium]